jgi:hypothetical protein
VIDVLARKGYRFKGTGTVHTDDEVVERALTLYETLGFGDYRSRIRGVVLVKVERAIEVTSPAYDLGRTEDEVRAEYAERFRAMIDRR